MNTKKVLLPMLVLVFGLLGAARGFPSHDEGEPRDCKRIRSIGCPWSEGGGGR